MKPLLIKGGRIIDPGQELDFTGNLLISDGKISMIAKDNTAISEGSPDIINAEGLIVCPGFIDLHCHLRQPGYEDKETIATGTQAAARGGFTTVCCMPNTNPAIDSQSIVDYIKSTAESEGLVRVLPIGCITKGRKGEALAEMGELAQAGVIGFSDDGSPVMNSLIMRHALDYSRTFGLPVIDHCEDTQLTKGSQMNEGVVSTKLGLRGWPSAAEEFMVARDLALAELTGARLHIAHVSTEGSVGLIREAKERGINVTAEVTPHHLTLTDEMVIGYDTNTKVNPPLRTQKDIEALIQGLKENVIDIIATDHAPHTGVDKLCEYDLAAFGISGLETALGSLISLVHGKQLSINTLISKLTTEPACIIGDRYGKLGSLEVGTTADITLLNPDMDWIVDKASFASKGKNTPLDGSKLKGKAVATISRGKIVYNDDSIKFIKGDTK